MFIRSCHLELDIDQWHACDLKRLNDDDVLSIPHGVHQKPLITHPGTGQNARHKISEYMLQPSNFGAKSCFQGTQIFDTKFGVCLG